MQFALLPFVACLIAAQVPASQPVRTDVADPAAAARIEGLLFDLGGADWRKRELATDALIDLGPFSYDAMKLAFDRTRRFEVRRRIKRAAREIFLAERSWPADGFLGIKRGSPDARLPYYHSAVAVGGIIDGTGAEAAGLREGDLILSLNGEYGTTRRPAWDYFADWWKRQSRGTTCTLGVLRGGEGVVNIEPGRGWSRTFLDGLEGGRVNHESEPRVPPGMWALRVDHVPTPGSPSDGMTLDVRPGDLILALNGAAFPDENVRTAFDEWIRNPVPAPPKDDIVAGDPASLRRLSMSRSLHVLRGGTWMEFNVKLGRRMPWLDDMRRLQPGFAQVLAEFSTWWRDQFDPQGQVVEEESTASSPSWILTPYPRP